MLCFKCLEKGVTKYSHEVSFLLSANCSKSLEGDMKPHSPSIGPLLAFGSARQLSPENTRHLYNIYTMLGQRRRRWADIV